MAERFKRHDRVLCLVGRTRDGGPVWVPGKVVTCDMEENEDYPEGIPYLVNLDGAKPYHGRTITAPVDSTNIIRAETCFADWMARFAVALPRGPPARTRRFAVGAKVVCRVDRLRNGGGASCRWVEGKVAAVDAVVPGQVGAPKDAAAYAISLSDGGGGGLVYASRDEHWLVRAAEHQGVGQCATESIPPRFEQKQRDGKWVRFDHVTTRANPCAAPGEDSDSDSDNKAKRPKKS